MNDMQFSNAMEGHRATADEEMEADEAAAEHEEFIQQERERDERVRKAAAAYRAQHGEADEND